MAGTHQCLNERNGPPEPATLKPSTPSQGTKLSALHVGRCAVPHGGGVGYVNKFGWQVDGVQTSHKLAPGVQTSHKQAPGETINSILHSSPRPTRLTVLPLLFPEAGKVRARARHRAKVESRNQLLCDDGADKANQGRRPNDLNCLGPSSNGLFQTITNG